MSNTAIVGCMFAGKTSMLIDLYNNNNTRKIAIKYEHDDRYCKNNIISHDGEHMSAVNVTNLLDINTKTLNDYDTFFIDEAQFFEDLEEFIILLKNNNKKFVYAGLDYDCLLNKFGKTLDMIGECDNVIRLCAKCECGKDAIYTKKKISVSGDIIDIGGEDKYTVVCENCYLI